MLSKGNFYRNTYTAVWNHFISVSHTSSLLYKIIKSIHIKFKQISSRILFFKTHFITFLNYQNGVLCQKWFYFLKYKDTIFIHENVFMQKRALKTIQSQIYNGVSAFREFCFNAFYQHQKPYANISRFAEFGFTRFCRII